jgi:beta-glucosidase
MPWADKAKSIVHTWYLGNATGDAIADVLLGKVNPAGRLSMTLPKRMEDLASYSHFTSEHGKVRFAHR